MMNRPEILDRTLCVIFDCIGHELYYLCLEKNMITSCAGLGRIPTFFPDLKILDLSDNKVN